MRTSRRQLLGLAVAVALLAGTIGSNAEEYPTRPVRIIVPFAAGGASDIVGRIIAQYLSEGLGKQFVVENRPGAGSNIGVQAIVSAMPDGYTIGLVGPSVAISASLYTKLPYNFLRDSAAVSGVMDSTNVMEVHPSVPAKTVSEFIQYAKANPGKINMGSSGVGASAHMSGELFKMMADVDLTHVPYSGGGPALAGLMANDVQVLFDNLPGSIGQIKAGTVRALAVTSKTRVDILPDLPAIAETVPGYEASTWYALIAPSNTPPEIIAKLNQAVNAILKRNDIKARFAELGGTPMLMTSAELAKAIADETEKWAKVVNFAGIKAD